MRVGFIGAGSMATAIARGAVAAGFDPSMIYFADHHPEKAQALASSLGGNTSSSSSMCLTCDLVVLAVKPHALTTVLSQIADSLDERTSSVILVSIATGRTIASIEEDLSDTGLDITVPIVRAMPNVNAQVGQSITAICANETATQNDADKVINLMNSVGKTEIIDEQYFPIFTAIASCSPAWILEIVDSLARAGVKYGLHKDQAVRIVSQAMSGTAQLMLTKAQQEAAVPAQLIDSVTSPGGTTIAGLLAAQRSGLGSALVDAVDAAVQKDHDLS